MSENSRYSIREISEFIDFYKEIIFNYTVMGIMPVRWTFEKIHSENKVIKILENAYKTRDKSSEYFFPKNMLLSLLILLSISLDQGLVWFLTSIPLLNNAVSFFAQIKIIFMALLFLVIIFYTSIGSYWSVVEFIINKNINKYIRIIVVFLMFGAVLLWVFFESQSWYQRNIQENSKVVGELIAFLNYTIIDEIIVYVLIYIPFLMFSILWLSRIIYLLITGLLSIIIWVIKIPNLYSAIEVCDFIEKEIKFKNNKFFLYEINKSNLIYIHKWAVSRQKIIQNKFIPFTLFFAVFAIIVSMGLADPVVSSVKEFGMEFFSNNQNTLFDVYLFFIIITVIELPIIQIVKLLNENFVVDFLICACDHALYSIEVKTIVVDKKENCFIHLIKKLRQN